MVAEERNVDNQALQQPDMEFVRFRTSGSVRWGVRHGETIHDLSEISPSYEEITNESYRQWVSRRIELGRFETVHTTDATLLAPVPSPGKLVCVGLNYRDHAEEQDEEIPERPMLFSKAPSSVIGPHDAIVHPEDVEQVDYEVELAVVIGRTASNVPAEAAIEYVAGYTVLNDVSARDAQFEDEQFFRGKSYDTFAPMGPALQTTDGIAVNDLSVRLRVNGETKQDSETSEFIFGVEELVEYISSVMTLHPGDVISTGTPGGVGIFRDPPELLEPNDSVSAEVEGIGTLTNDVVAESDIRP